MCTLTIIPNHRPGHDGVRVVMNRDESRLRPKALPPEPRQFGSRQFGSRQFGPRQGMMPVDPVSDGTWIGASDAPLAAMLMNVYTGDYPIGLVLPRSVPLVSRGTIIPRVLAAGTLGEAVSLAKALEFKQFEPFRLVMVDRRALAVLTWAADRCVVDEPAPIERPVFFTSSGLGDAVVTIPRRTLFEEQVTAAKDWPVAQDAFHRHVWPGREFASVWMSRPEARTVSVTTVELNSSRVRMSYLSRDDEQHTTEYPPIELAVSGR